MLWLPFAEQKAVCQLATQVDLSDQPRAVAGTFWSPRIRLMQNVSSSFDSDSALSQCLGG